MYRQKKRIDFSYFLLGAKKDKGKAEVEKEEQEPEEEEEDDEDIFSSSSEDPDNPGVSTAVLYYNMGA